MADARAIRKSCLILITLGILAAWAVVIARVSVPRDFVACYAAGSLLLRHPHSLYSLTAQMRLQRSVANAQFLPWAHPAPEALLYAPLALLSYRKAFSMWTAVNFGILLLSVWVLREEIGTLSAGSLCAVLAFAWYPIGLGLVLGQDHCLFLLLWALAYRQLKAGDEFRAGLWIGLSLIRYQFAVPVLLFFIVRREWKLLQGVAVSASALMAASFAIVGPGLVPAYLHLVRVLASIKDSAGLIFMPTLRGLAGLVLLSSTRGAVVAAIVAGLILLVWALPAASRMKRLDALCFAMVAGLLIDPHAFIYELTVLVIPLLLFLRKYPQAVGIPVAVAAAALAASVLHRYIFAPIALVLLAWAIWMSRAYSREAIDSAASSAGVEMQSSGN